MDELSVQFLNGHCRLITKMRKTISYLLCARVFVKSFALGFLFVFVIRRVLRFFSLSMKKKTARDNVKYQFNSHYNKKIYDKTPQTFHLSSFEFYQ